MGDRTIFIKAHFFELILNDFCSIAVMCVCAVDEQRDGRQEEKERAKSFRPNCEQVVLQRNQRLEKRLPFPTNHHHPNWLLSLTDPFHFP